MVFQSALQRIHKKTLLIYSKTQTIELWGGHGGIHSTHEPIRLTAGDYKIFDIDFSSFYPSIMTHRDCVFIDEKAKETMRKLITKRVAIKKSDPVRSTALKIFLNSLYGKLRDYSPSYPHPGQLVICTAQIVLAQLLKVLESARFKLIDVNTDGVLCIVRNNFDVDNLVKEFSESSGYPLEATPLEEVFYQKSGNYIAKDTDGKFKSKGGWLSSTNATQKYEGVIYNCVNLTEIISTYLSSREVLEPRIFVQSNTGENRVTSIVNSLPWGFDKTSFMGSSIFLAKNILPDVEGDSPIKLSKKLIYNKLHTCIPFQFKGSLYE